MERLLVERPIHPNVEELLAILRREKKPQRVHPIELFLDKEIKEAVSYRFGLKDDLNRDDPEDALKMEIRVHRFLGYDVFRLPIIRKDYFTLNRNPKKDTVAGSLNRGDREWAEEHRGPIQTWEDFASYPWPTIDGLDLRDLEWMEKNLPSDMGCYDLTAHILEMVTFLLGYETLCYKIYDDMPLVEALCQKIGEFYLAYTRLLCSFDCVAVIWGSDDMGFRTSTMVSPVFLREKILPWHKACAEIAHQNGRPYLIHACGNLEEIMDDLIEKVGIDAKHSFEDAILPVTEAYKRYSDRVALLGGIDVDFLCRSEEPAIRRRVRETLEVCMAKKGYCLGTGNTVANYIPLESYLIMLDEGRRFFS